MDGRTCRHVLWVAVTVALMGGCSGGDGGTATSQTASTTNTPPTTVATPQTSTTSSTTIVPVATWTIPTFPPVRERTFIPPTLEPPEPGVAAEVVVMVHPGVDPGSEAAISFREKARDWVGVQPDSDGLRLRFEGCQVRAPGEWVFEGTVEVPSGMEGATVGLAPTVCRSDVCEGSLYEARFSGSGRFALGHSTAFSLVRDSVAGDPTGRRPPSVYRTMDRGSCGLELSWSDVPVAGFEGGSAGLQEPDLAAEPLTWEAPEGTVQSLGSGVILADPDDPRTTWAYHTWLQVHMPFELVAIPEPFVGPSVRLVRIESDPDDKCQVVILELDNNRGEIWQGSRCHDPPFAGETTGDPIEEGSPFRWITTDNMRPAAIAHFGETTVIIRARGEGDPAIPDIARSLRWYQNLIGYRR